MDSHESGFEGHVDRIDKGVVRGWAWRRDLPNEAISVEVRVDDQSQERITAGLYRADLEAAGKGNGRHAFAFTLPDRYLDGETHSLRAVFGERSRDLIGSPASFSFHKDRRLHESSPRRPMGFGATAQSVPGPEPVESAVPGTGGGWVTAVANPPGARVLPHVRLFAVLGTWMEGDVVAATIRNAVTQGCERVYVVDNASPDDTAEIATAEGAIVARSFRTERYDERLRLRHMNNVVSEISAQEVDPSIWWLFLDADEFPHGPWGMTLRDYLRTLDERFRIVGARFFDHYPSTRPHYAAGQHPLDCQPLCEELAYPMCPSRHRKHPLQRCDKHRPPIECGTGFHQAECPEPLLEPLQPVFLHHFPFRDESVTRKKLAALWAKDQRGDSRALEEHDTHMLARFRSLDAVYSQRWAAVHNFIALDPMRSVFDSPPAAHGVRLQTWSDLVEPEHQHVLRWYPTAGAWKYASLDQFNYGDDTTYKKGIAFLDGHGTIEDWGCGFAHARTFVTESQYIGLDGSSKHADEIVDLTEYASTVDCIFMRHVLEHNADWRRILANAVASFRSRMVLVIFTPFAEMTCQIATSTTLTSIPVPDISFRKEDLTQCFAHLHYLEESLATDTQYGVEHIFYIDKQRPSYEALSPSGDDVRATHVGSTVSRTAARELDEQLRNELDEWAGAGLTARFWWRDDDAVADTPQLRRLIDTARAFGFTVALAVVPERADQSLVDVLSTAPCRVWQHGWGHHFHASGEFGDGRALTLMIEDGERGQRALDWLFGPDGWQRVFVPPNHMLSMAFKTLVPTLGYLGVSAGVPLTAPVEGVAEVNAEIDVMDWPAGRILSSDTLCAMVLEQLRSRRQATVPDNRPIGLLTHHLALDDAGWALLREFVRLLIAHPSVEVVDAGGLFDRKVVSETAPRGPENGVADITVVITSCGRQDLLVRTLETFFEFNTYPIRQFIVIEDGEADANKLLAERYRGQNFRWLATGSRVGQIAAIDIAYGFVETEYIFHCEDDWEFHAPGFVEKSLTVLRRNPNILQVWIRGLDDTNNHPVVDDLLFADEVPYRLLQSDYHSAEWGTWHGFAWNPGLRRRRDYQLIGSFRTLDPFSAKKSYEVEREASEFYWKHGLSAAILADNGGRGYVRHLGWGRRVAEPHANHSVERVTRFRGSKDHM